MDKAQMLEFWDELWAKSMWYPALNLAFKDLSPQQAAWKPQAGRNSIWQNLNHLCFWREVVVGRTKGIKQPPQEVIDRENFAEPAEVSDNAWREAQQRFERSQKLVHDAIESGGITMEQLKMMVPHDAYHVGQVMHLRAMQGRPAVEYG